MKTRFVGRCPVCERDFKLSGGGMVHHGYRRPGDGCIHGDCFAVAMAPYEASCEGSKLYKAALEGRRVQPAVRLAELQSGAVEALTVLESGSRSKRVEILKSANPSKFEQALQSAIWNIKGLIKNLDRDIARMAKLIEGWTIQPARTFEEEEAKGDALKGERKAAKDTALKAKIAKKVAFYQGRIDSAFKKKNANSIRDLFEAVTGAASGLKLNFQEMFDLIDRKSAWDHFGLITPASRWDRVNDQVLQKMWAPGYWPS